MKELILIQSTLNAPKNRYNSFGKYKYRSVEDILEALKPLLSQHNCILTLSDEIRQIGDRHYIVATATFTNSEGFSVSVQGWAREEDSKKGMDSCQLTGSTSSYARKCALNGMFLIDDNEDSDSTNKHDTPLLDRIKTRLEACTDVAQLGEVYKALSKEEQAKYKDITNTLKAKLSVK